MMLEHPHKNEIAPPLKEGVHLGNYNMALIPGCELPSGQKRPESANSDFPRAGIDSYLLGGSLLGEIDRTREQKPEKPIDLRIVRNTPEELNRLLFAPEKGKKAREGMDAEVGEEREKENRE